MACKPICKICNKLVISDSVTVSGTNLLIDIPSASYNNGSKYCIVVAQSIPSTATIDMPVYITIGGVTTTLYPLNRCDCSQAVASQIRARTRYSTIVSTTSTGGSFNMIGKLPCVDSNAVGSLPITAETTGG